MFSIQKSLNVDHHINRRKKKNLMIMSTDAKKAFEVQHPFMIKTLRNLGIKGNFLNSVKDIYKKPTTNIILNEEKLKALLLRSSQGYIFSPLLFNILEVLSNSIRDEK